MRHATLSGVSTTDKVGWLYPKHSILKGPIDGVMKELLQKGIERKLYDANFPRLSKIQCKVSTFRPVGLDILYVVFKILAVGCGIAIFFMIIENIVKGIQRILK